MPQRSSVRRFPTSSRGRRSPTGGITNKAIDARVRKVAPAAMGGTVDWADVTGKPTIPSTFADLGGQVADSQVPAAFARDSELPAAALLNRIPSATSAANKVWKTDASGAPAWRDDAVGMAGSGEENVQANWLETDDTSDAFIQNKPSLFSGAYNDLTGLPSLFDGDYGSLTNRPVLFSGAFGDLTGVPELFDGDYNSLSNLPVLFDGSYDSLTNKPDLFSGSYDDLTDKPTIPAAFSDLSGQVADSQIPSGIARDSELPGSELLGRIPDYTTTGGKVWKTDSAGVPGWRDDEVGMAGSGEENVQSDWDETDTGADAYILNKPDLFSGSYDDLTNKPNLFDGDYASLTNIPALFDPDKWFLVSQGQVAYSNNAGRRLVTLTIPEITESRAEDVIFYQWRDGVPSSSAENDEVYMRVNSGAIYPIRYTEGANSQNICQRWQMPRFGYVMVIRASGSNYYLVGGSKHILSGTALSISVAADQITISSSTGANVVLTGAQIAALTSVAALGSSGGGEDNVQADWDETDTTADSFIQNKPTLFSGAYADLSGAPSLFSGAYSDLSGLPSLFSGAYADLSGLPSLFSGSYNDLTDKPTLFSGAYADLTGKPNIPATFADLTGSIADSQIPAGIARDVELPSAALLGRIPTASPGNNKVWKTNSSGTPGWRDDEVGSPGTGEENVQADWAETDTTADAFIQNKPTLFSGAYDDLTGKPALFDGNYNSLTNKPALFSGAYADLSGLPTLFDGAYSSLSGTPSIPSTFADLTGQISDAQIPPAIARDSELPSSAVLGRIPSATTSANKVWKTNASGVPAWRDDAVGSPGTGEENVQSDWTETDTGADAYILNKPTLFSGAYDDLTGKPSLFDGDYNSLSNLPTLFSGAYNDLTGKPSLFSGAYADLTGLPDLFSGSWDDLDDKPTLFDGDYNSLTNLPTLFDDLYSVPSANVAYSNQSGNRLVTLTISAITESSEGELFFFQWRDGVPSTSARGDEIYMRVNNGAIYPMRYTEGFNSQLICQRWQMPRFGYVLLARAPGANYYVVGGSKHILSGTDLGKTVAADQITFTSSSGANVVLTGAEIAALTSVAALRSTQSGGEENVQADWNETDTTSDAFIQNKPSLFNGDYNSLSNLPTLFSGAYADLSGAPDLFSGIYDDLIGKPVRIIARRTSNQALSATSFLDVLTLTIPVAGTEVVRLSWSLLWSFTQGSIDYRIMRGTTEVATLFTPYGASPIGGFFLDTPGTGIHTYNIEARREGSGAVSVLSNSSMIAEII